MKKVLLMLALMIGAVTMIAQEDRDESVKIDTTTIPYLNELALTDSLLLDVNAWLEHIEINLSLGILFIVGLFVNEETEVGGFCFFVD